MTRQIYAITNAAARRLPWEWTRGKPDAVGRIKVGQTSRDPHKRLKELLAGTGSPTREGEVLRAWNARRPDGTEVSDKEVHARLKAIGASNTGEWFDAHLHEVAEAFEEAYGGSGGRARRTHGLRPEQEAAVEQTLARQREHGPGHRMLWNAKMRFGKCFTALMLGRRMGAQRILILTGMPMVQDAWKTEVVGSAATPGHEAFEEWGWWGNNEREPTGGWKTMVRFQSAQGLRAEEDWGQKRIEELRQTHWDLVVLDEQHYGLDKDRGKEDVHALELKVGHWLELSGTPFRDLAIGTFGPKDRYSWTYSDEQRAKQEWASNRPEEPNPYGEMPTMQFNVYSMAPELEAAARKEDGSWTLDEMFRAENAKFIHEETVLQWLESIQKSTSDRETRTPYGAKSGALHNASRHSVWLFSRVESCKAMRALLAQHGKGGLAPERTEVINVGGSGELEEGGEGQAERIRAATGGATRQGQTRTLTLTCGRLMSGVSIPAWGTILMLYGGTSATRYLQAAFRVQTAHAEGGTVLKPTGYVFDYDPNRSLAVFSDYATHSARARADRSRQNAAGELTRFMEIVWHHDGERERLDAGALLRKADEGLQTSLMAKRWRDPQTMASESDLVQIAESNDQVREILNRLVAHANPLRSRSEMVEVTKHETLRNRKTDAEHGEDDNQTPAKEPKSKLSEEERRQRKASKEIRKKLMVLLGKLPLFMYLTEHREATLHDLVATKDRELFIEVTGISPEDTQILVDSQILKDAMLTRKVEQFREAERPSLGYLGAAAPEG